MEHTDSQANDAAASADSFKEIAWDTCLFVPHVMADGTVTKQGVVFSHEQNVILRIERQGYDGFEGVIYDQCADGEGYTGSFTNENNLTYSILFQVRRNPDAMLTIAEQGPDKVCMSIYLHHMVKHVTTYGKTHQYASPPSEKPEGVSDYEWLVTTSAYRVMQSGRYVNMPREFPVFKSALPLTKTTESESK
jgi:hypothetical protein